MIIRKNDWKKELLKERKKERMKERIIERMIERIEYFYLYIEKMLYVLLIKKKNDHSLS